MTVPDIPAVTLPVLEVHADGKDHSTRELVDTLAIRFGLSEDDLGLRTRSGPTVFRKRIEWARYYLIRAGLLHRSARGLARVTSEGVSLLEQKPERIDRQILSRYQGFISWVTDSPGQSTVPAATNDPDGAETLTPEERLDDAYQELRRTVEEELLERIKSMPPDFFERLVVELLLRLGYGGTLGAGQTLGRTGDGGVDGLIKQDRLGLDLLYIQAKRWDGNVGRPEIQTFAGSLEGFRARKGIFITTSSFTRDAAEYVGRIEKAIVLIDGATLTSLMFDTGLGVATTATYEVKRIDTDFFEENDVT